MISKIINLKMYRAEFFHPVIANDKQKDFFKPSIQWRRVGAFRKSIHFIFGFNR